jgi:PhnB protein
MSRHIRNGRGSIRPYIYGPLELERFVKTTFAAKEIERNDAQGFLHLEIAIGDSVLTLSLWKKSPPPSASPAATYVYVEDADAAYSRALTAGGVSERAPMDAHYGERTSTVRDVGANIWYIATYTGVTQK